MKEFSSTYVTCGKIATQIKSLIVKEYIYLKTFSKIRRIDKYFILVAARR